MLRTSGYLKPVYLLHLSDKDELIKAVWLRYMFFLPHAELEQLKKGLRGTLQLEPFICKCQRDAWHFSSIHKFRCYLQLFIGFDDDTVF